MIQLNVLESLYDGIRKDAHYFVVEMRDKHPNYDKESKLVLVALPNEIKEILYNTAIDTITVKQARQIYCCYVDANIYITPKYPPFQIGQQVFRDAIYCSGLVDVDVRLLYDKNFKSCYEVTKFFAELNKEVQS